VDVQVDRRPPLRWTITIGATAIVILALLIAALAVTGLLNRSIATGAERSLIDRVDAVREVIRSGDLPDVLEPTGRETGQIQVRDSDGALVASTLGLGRTSRFDVIDAPVVGATVTARVDGSIIDNNPSEQYLIVASTVQSADGPLTIYGVTSLEPAFQAEDYLESRLLVVLPLLGLVTGVVVFTVVGRALRPVEHMRSQVEQITANDLSMRVIPPASDDEIARLGATLNGLLDRLDRSAVQQRVFAASASHELRSPLSAIRTNLEVGLAYPERTDWEQTATDALIEIARLEQLSTDLRTLTRQHENTTRHATDIAAATISEIERRSDHRLRTSISEERVMVAIGVDSYLQVLRNLLDNASRHARTDVVVTIERLPSLGVLSVYNDGPPLSVADRATVFEPFTRLDEARSLDTGGSGLGLAIARTIVHAAGGSIDAADRDDGAEFRVLLPLSPGRDEPTASN